MKRGESWYWWRVAPVLALCVVWVLFPPSCKTAPRPGSLPGSVELPRIDPPAPKARRPLEVRADALPHGASAHFPAYDGDSFYVTLPVRQQKDVSAKEVADRIIRPILGAVGFQRGMSALSAPPARGVEMPRANFAGLAQAVASEYADNRELLRPKTRMMIDVFLGRQKANEEINGALQMGEGMNFAQFVAGIERLEIQYPFQQQVDHVPIEHTLLVASRWEGQDVTSVRGVLFNEYTITNLVTLDKRAAILAAIEALRATKGVERVTSRVPEDGPVLVLLPFGTVLSGQTNLRYAYRMILRGAAGGQQGPFLLWLDAETSVILKLEALFDDVTARGETWRRDPGIGTQLRYFQVDPAVAGEYVLRLGGVINRVDYQGDGLNALDISIPDNSGGSSSTFANFDQMPINNETEALCGSGTNKAYQQVNFFATIHRYYKRSLSLGIFTPFPTSPWNPVVEKANYCNANSSMTYGACEGYFNAACPDYTTGDSAGENFMNFAHDNPVIGHELAHNITPRMTNARPSDWCGMPVCAIPVGWSRFHDLADFWADHFDSTNCTGGWVGKNLNGVDASLYCLSHDEGGYLPRIHQVTVPFNPGNPGDHYPEHRALATGGYADGQIGAAALWQVRLGMRSKCRPSGMPQFAVRFARALKETGFLGFTPTATDLDIYRLLYDLELQMVEQWATSGSPMGPPAFKHNGPHTTNKVTAGFARAGVFLIPYQCIDGDPGTTDPLFCPAADNGGDAVIDIDDNDLGDDLSIDGVDHPEWDFLEAGGPPPTFHVWTGPRYQYSGTSADVTVNPCLCNTKFMVEVANDPTFPPASTISSPWIDVDTDPTTAVPPECYGTWTPSLMDWSTLQSGGMRIYYRATTRDASDGNERLSTMPGNGLWTVDPPYAVVTADGRSDY